MGKYSFKKKKRPAVGEGENPSLLDARVGSGFEAQLLCAGGSRPCFMVDVYRQGTGELVRRFEFQTRHYRNARDFMVGVASGTFRL